MKRFFCCIVALTSFFASTADAQSARDILNAGGIRGGLVVHLGCGDGKLTAELGKSESFLVHGLTADAAGVAEARKNIRAAGLYGNVSVDVFGGKHLPYADNLVNLLVVSDHECQVIAGEIDRVLAPRGVALFPKTLHSRVSGLSAEIVGDWLVYRKPVPTAIDDWTHYLYDAGNNPVSKDTKVAAPKHIQWWAPPKYSRTHEIESTVPIAVTAGGRIVYIVDDGLTGIIDKRLPETWSLVGRDAFSGVKLWKIPLPNWGWKQWRPERAEKSFFIQDYSESKPPVALARRLVMDSKHAFVTLGWQAPVSMLDAATGHTLATFEGTEGTQEILHHQGILYLIVKVNSEERNGNSYVAAVDPNTKQILWKSKPAGIQPEMFAVHGEHVYYHTQEEMLCLERKNGEVKWRHADNRRNDYFLSGSGLVVTERAVYLVNRGSLLALNPKSGEVLWRNKGMVTSAGGNAPNLFEINGLVWGATSPESGFRGLDPATGKVSKTLDERGTVSRGHHIRCFRAKATTRYIIWPKRGTEVLDLDGENHSRHDWVRGSCRFGLMPANGMLYVPPHQCFCYQGVLLNGFMALAPKRDAGASMPQLKKGPAFDLKSTGAADAEDWPCYRSSNLRLGSTETTVGTKPQIEWKQKVGGRLAPPVLADGQLYVVQTERGVVNVLDADTGKTKWRFIAGYRIDSPPTIIDGRVLFGCNNGYVYCLSATDGALVWRFRAAPSEQRIIVDDRLESPWPVGGSVLTVNGLAYLVAGRSTYLDGGLYLYALDLATGQTKHSHNYAGPSYEEGKIKGRGFEMEGSKGDLLSTDGEKIYLYANIFSLDLKREAYQPPDKNGLIPQGLHVITTGGFTDDHAWNRNFWTYSKRWPGFYFANQAPKSGQLLVVDKKTTYAVKQYTTRNLLSPMFFPNRKGYLLFADDNTNEPNLYGEKGSKKPIPWLPALHYARPQALGQFDLRAYSRDKYAGYTRVKPPKWQKWIPVRVRAMVRTGNSLFAAGPPDILKKGDELAAFQGRAGGKLLTLDPDTGEVANEMGLKSPPVFDGLIAAGGHLYMCTCSGNVVRFQ